MGKFDQQIAETLRRPYHWVIQPDEDGVGAFVLEFPGCFGGGDTVEEALSSLRDGIEVWVEAVLDLGQNIPEPIDPESMSGTLTLRIPPSLHYRAQLRAQLEGVSLNRLLSDAVSRYMGDLPRLERYPSTQPDIRGVAEGAPEGAP